LFFVGLAKARFGERFEEPVLQKCLKSFDGRTHEGAGLKVRVEEEMDIMTQTEVEAAVLILTKR